MPSGILTELKADRLLGCGFDEVERTAYLPKDLGIDRGDTVTVAGSGAIVAGDWAVGGNVS